MQTLQTSSSPSVLQLSPASQMLGAPESSAPTNVAQLPYENPIPEHTPSVKNPVFVARDEVLCLTGYENLYGMTIPEYIHSQNDLDAIRKAFDVIKPLSQDILQDGEDYQNIIQRIQDKTWQEALLDLGIKLKNCFLVAEKICFGEEIQKMNNNSPSLKEAAAVLVSSCNYKNKLGFPEETLVYNRQNPKEFLNKIVNNDNRPQYLERIVNLVPESDRTVLLRAHIVRANWLSGDEKTSIIEHSGINEEDKTEMLESVSRDSNRALYECPPS